MTHRPDFAPVSKTESSLLRFGAGYFMLNGVIYGVIVATVLVAYALGSLPFAPTLSTVVNILVPIAMAVGLFWTGMLLSRRSRLGGCWHWLSRSCLSRSQRLHRIVLTPSPSFLLCSA